MDPLLRVINLSKNFGALSALEQVSFEVYPGEVLGLAGRSGAGKSVLAMLIAGLEEATRGDIYFAGRRLHYPFATRALGIEVIHQEPILAESLDITDNIFLGNEISWTTPRAWLNLPSQVKMDKEAFRILGELGVFLNSLREKVVNLSGEQRQLIAIAQAMTHSPKLIFVDEPTVLLSYPYQQKLLALIQAWQQQGISIIFSSNNLEHLFAVTDRLIVLRRGRNVATYSADETNREEVVAALVGAPDHQQITPAIWALDSYYRAREQSEKLRHQQTLLQKNLSAQDTLNQQLIDQLAEQVNALDKANVALQAAQRRLIIEREQERKHLARELHDQVIQDLLSANYQLEEIEGDEIVTPLLKEQLTDARQSIRGMVSDLRQICGDLRPPTIDSLGLGAAIQSYAHTWTERTGIEATLALDAKLGRLPEAIELSVFRIVQEALNNVRKHAQASSVKVSLEHTSPRMLMILVADNGTGLADNFDLSALSAAGHYGLLGISERVALLGGRLKLQNQPDGGMMLQVEIPHPRANVSS